MTPHNIDTLLTILGIIAFSGLGLIGLKIFVNAWVRRKELAGTDLSELPQTVESLRTDTDALRAQLTAEITELHERMDFAERILTQVGSQPRLPESRNDQPTV